MSDISTTGAPWYRGRAFRYGMLLLILFLFASSLWEIVGASGANRVSARMGLVVSALLLMNHLVESFLSVERQRMVRIPQFILLGLAALYVIRSMAGLIRP
jgi:hypothetical protein